jgi:hypothetical protein
MREICKSGSEGGAGQTNVSFLPLSFLRDAKSNFKVTLVLGRIYRIGKIEGAMKAQRRRLPK